MQDIGKISGLERDELAETTTKLERLDPCGETG